MPRSAVVAIYAAPYPSSPGDENAVHTAEFVTPTGHHYRSTAPPAPDPMLVEVSEIETCIGIAIAARDAA